MSHAEWLWGWDPTPGIVSVHADQYGRATVWRRLPATGELRQETDRFRPWLLLDRLDDLLHLGDALGTGDDQRSRIRHRELEGPGALRHLVSADDDGVVPLDAPGRGRGDRGKRDGGGHDRVEGSVVRSRS